MDLAEYAEPLAWDAAFWLLAFDAPACPLADLGPFSEDLHRKLRAAGIVALVTRADSDTFLHDLIRSGRVRRRFLSAWAAAGRDDDHSLAASRLDGWYDAVAAGDLETAKAIAALSPTRWHPSREYEEDFLWAHVLFALLGGERDRSVLEARLDRMERALDGFATARLPVGRALVAGDQAALDAAFEALLDERDRTIAEDVARGEMEDPIVVAQRVVYVEGLALLRLADALGLATQREYRMCPSLARLPMRRPFPDE